VRNQFPVQLIQNAQKQGAVLLQQAGIEPEVPGVALAVEKHRWYWRPPQVRVILIAESHIHTSAADLSLQIKRDSLPPIAQDTPPEFARIIYCLGYGEPELLSGTTKRRNAGTRQFWDLFGRLAGTGKQPRRRDRAFTERLNWKIQTLQTLQQKGVWVLDASLHAMYAPGGKRIPNSLKFALHQLWWNTYGSYLLVQMPTTKVWIIGKTVANDLQRLNIPYDGWIYQPGAGRSPQRDLEQGWGQVLEDIQSQ
jgi:hypothetical protein